MIPRSIAAAVAVAAAISGCSRDPAPAPKTRPIAPSPQPIAPAAAPAPAGEIDEALRERLARQEAAARLFEKNVPQPPPPKAAERPVVAPRPAAPRVEPKPEPPKVEVARAEPPRPAPAPPRSTQPAPATATPPPSAPPATMPVPAPVRTEVAAVRPAPPPDSVATRLVSRVDPDFPREAVQAGVDQGTVKARMTLDGSGAVTRVEILEANPRRIFDRAVVRALSQWRYSEGAAGRTVDMEVAFRR